LTEKPLRLLAGEPLVRHVARRVLEFDLGPVVVATDDLRVAEAVSQLGVEVVVEENPYRSGTERTAGVARLYPDVDIVLNVQGDEPLLPYQAAAGALARVLDGAEIGTAAGVVDPGDVWNRDRVKVVVDRQGRAVEFFRIPTSPVGSGGAVYQHVGVYAYTTDALLRWVALEPVPDETALGLEQLRPLAHGMRIEVSVLDRRVPHGVDTEADLEAIDRQLGAMSQG
jgi:3-deoxy-manno-octulosonate cytidylyltransferase (CMP-KDO synthetase)